MRGESRQRGFSLIEVLVVMVILSIIIVAASQMFVKLLGDFKVQSKITATNIEGMMGLETLRRDISHAGYGLYYEMDGVTPPAFPAYAIFTEVMSDPNGNGQALNDVDTGIPRPLVFGGGRGLNGSDRIAVKSLNVAPNMSSEHFNYLFTEPTPTLNVWLPLTENIDSNDYVIVVRPDKEKRYLMFASSATGTHFYSQYKDVLDRYTVSTTSLVFSLGTTTTPRAPFNRADYYIANTGMPSRCAAGTGVLYKAVLDQRGSGTAFQTPIPLLDCVADMQVAYRFDSTGSGVTDMEADVTGDEPIDLASPAISALFISNHIREVRIYLLVQEGQRDRNYTYPNSTVTVGEKPGGTPRFGRDFNMATITDWQHYRWKLYTLIIEPIILSTGT